MSNDQSNPRKKDDLVVTPGGPRLRDRVHAVCPGEPVQFDEFGSSIPVASNELQVQNFKDQSMASDFIFTPFGRRHRSLVHRIEPGHAVNVDGGRLRLVHLATGTEIEIPKPAVDEGAVAAGSSNWITYTYWQNNTGTPISSFRSTWKVPPPPSSAASQLIYLFNGMEPLAQNAILQPVLQWGTSGFSGAGDGPYWTVASWYVDPSGHAFFSPHPHARVNPGDTLVGVMTLTSQSGGKFNYTCEFQGIPGTNLPLLGSPELVWCSETLEAYEIGSSASPPYDLNSALEYPATQVTAFEAINIQTGSVNPTVTWAAVNLVTKFGEHAVPVNDSSSNGEVDLFYPTPPGGFASLGGNITTDPAVGRNADGRLEVFARGTDGALWHIWQNSPGGGWSGWSSLAGGITTNPAVGINADGRLEVFARGTDDALWHIWQNSPGGGWSGWNSLAGGITANPAQASNYDGRLEVFVRGTDDALWHRWQTSPGGGWS
ncbi:MAG TPA: hypothetical protein VFI31_13095 [Pirellulales bacterium]|nr:hypothetical protein [Pirellulales bacterium]